VHKLYIIIIIHYSYTFKLKSWNTIKVKENVSLRVPAFDS